ncbi:MAG: DUF4166 domain-containing protein [Pseudomonadales bacterium]|jgi:hypothetical protein|nr:DUF4166 domain-containing protein [Pseudomonadales bacterium]
MQNLQKSLMQQALGDAWEQLPPALQAHYRAGGNTESGHLDIDYPRFMQPLLTLLRWMGALIDRSGTSVQTLVQRNMAGERQLWRRSMSYADGQVRHFNSFWLYAGGNRLLEFINPVLGLEMAVRVDEQGRLHYEGQRFVLKLGRWLLTIPEWLALGHTTIVERALSENRYDMDFRLTHPIFGQVFRYSGEFEVEPRSSSK